MHNIVPIFITFANISSVPPNIREMNMAWEIAAISICGPVESLHIYSVPALVRHILPLFFTPKVYRFIP